MPTKRHVLQLAAALAAAALAGAAVADDAGPDLGEVMLTPIVQRLAELGGSVSRLNQTELLRTPAGVTSAQLETALNAVIARHDRPGDTHLVGYIVGTADPSRPGALRSGAIEKLTSRRLRCPDAAPRSPAPARSPPESAARRRAAPCSPAPRSCAETP